MEEVKNNGKVESTIEEDKIDPQKDAEIIKQEKKERVDQCGQEVMMALKKYNCNFDVSMVLRQGGIMPNIQIVAK